VPSWRVVVTGLRIVAALLLLLAGAELLACSSIAQPACELSGGGGPEQEDGCLCCCRHIMPMAPVILEPTPVVEFPPPASEPAQVVVPRAPIYHPPRA
jgi:hypothetical protein